MTTINKRTNEGVVPGTPTQVEHPGQAIKRTLTVVLSGVGLAIAVLELFNEVFGVWLGEDITSWLLAALALGGALSAFLQRLITLSQLQDFLEKIGLGTGVEKEEVVPDTSPGGPDSNPLPPTFG